MSRQPLRGFWRRARYCAASLLLAVFPAAIEPQAPPAAPQTQGSTPGAQAPAAQTAPAALTAPSHASSSAKTPTSIPTATPTSTPTSRDRRRAAKLYLAASKLYVNSQFEQALKGYEQAAALDPGNADYRMAIEVARSHLVTALIQTAAKDRLTGNEAGALAALTRALALDPHNPEAAQHLDELGDEATRGQPQSLYQQRAAAAGASEPLLATPGTQSLHLRSDGRQVIQQAFKLFGITALLDDSVRTVPVRIDLDNVDFNTAMRILGMATDTFYVPLDAHRVLVARDTRENRQQFTREQLETVYLYGISSTDLTEAGNLAKNVFNIQQVAADPGASSLTLRAAPGALDAFNTSMRGLLRGQNQLMLDVRLMQVAHTSSRNTGVQPPQSISAFNVYAEEQSILNANQSLVQQIISSGLASPGDTLAILGILLASGQVSSSLFSGGIALFGGGLTQSALSPGGPATLNFNLNSSDSRILDHIELRLGDGEAGTIKEGIRYPIQTSAVTTQGSLPNIPGLTGAGASGGLSSLLSSLAGAVPAVPMIQYQDLGLTLKVTPKVLRGGDVALTTDLTIDALSGSSLNGNPILNHQAFSGVVTLKVGEAAEFASQLDQQESRAISGTPGLSDVPGLNDATEKTIQKNYSSLVIIMTPHLIRATQPAGPSPQMRIDKGLATP